MRRSDNITAGPERMPNRSLLRACGMTDEEMNQPIIGVVSAYSEIIPGHINLDKIADAVKAGVRMAGGTPVLVPAIGVCDGIAMGHIGMKYSLASRELIADSVETLAQAHQLDGLVLIPNCDKIVPGMLMAAARLNIPSILVSGGPMMAGHFGGEEVSLSKTFEAVGAYKAGMMDEATFYEAECNSCPGCGSCAGMYTANSMNCLSEAIGMALPGNGTTPAVSAARIHLAKHAGMKIMELIEKDIRPRDILTPAAFRNALTQTDPQAAGRALDAIRQYQQARTPSLQPLRIEAEILYNRADIFRISFRAYLILGGILLVTALRGMFGKNKRRATLAARVVSIAIFIVFALHTFGLGLRSYISGHAPWTNAYESMVYVAWATVLSGIVFARRSKLALALAALLGGVVLFVSNLNWLDPQITPLVPVLKSYWLMIHVSVITASYGFFGICAACGIASLIATIAGKNLAELRIINEMAMLVGLVLLTTGIFFGAVWANESWGRYWGWDPKETWALITMIVYAVTTHLHFIPRLNTNPLVFDVMSVVGFSTVLMTFFGVNYYLSGLHSYGKSEGFSPEIVLAAGAGVLVLVAVAAVRYHKNKKTS